MNVEDQIRAALAAAGIDGSREDVTLDIKGIGGPGVRVLVNENLKMSPRKMAAQAVHAALFAFGIDHGRVVVLGGRPGQIENMQSVVCDAGVTELAPGTMTAGAELEPWAEETP